MPAYVIGQRFVSETEPELGLGAVTSAGNRRVTLEFTASDTVRQYAMDSAPIKRVTFRTGDEVEDVEGRRMRVDGVEESGGLLVYRCRGERLPETELAGTLRFSKPEERLKAGLWDRSRTFELRYRSLRHRHDTRKSEVRGFLGARIELIPHQLFIGAEVASRPYPRALLADEVGLGKTIEAGLVLHRLLRSGQVTRVLLLVPESLVHQWFVEMLRRFHLSFTLASEEYCRAVEESHPGENPFSMTQTAIASMELLARNPARASEIEQAGWDLLVVDEAHHLEWSEKGPSPEYALVAAVAARADGLLLLTATPEQLGAESHFARLRLLDPDRYARYEDYREEARRYKEVARIAGKLIDEEPLAERDVAALDEVLPLDAARLRERLRAVAAGDVAARWPFLQDLMDQHGPGRVVFRNSRSVLDAFPERRVRAWELAWPSRREVQYERLAKEFVTDTRDTGVALDYDYQDDVRVAWLVALLRDLAPEKVLVITRFRGKAKALHDALRHANIQAGLFHEDLSLLQRDRNAAWFADEEGTQVLICSEIGSEGRNFQFSHHLVLFDLPLSPELLEQRIGRLYRIGQEHAVEIHVPLLPGSPQQMLFMWFHDGLDAFENGLPEGSYFDPLGSRLRDAALDHLERSDPTRVSELPAGLDRFLAETRAFRESVAEELSKGRDRLLELSSFRPARASALVEEIRKWDADENFDRFVADALDYLGVELDEVSPRTFVLRQGNQLVVDALPGLRSKEVAMTSDRDKATHQGELDFLTWDHPMVAGILEILLGGEHGNSAVAILPAPGADAMLLEAVFVLEAVAAPELYLDRFLPPMPVRIVVNHRLEDVSDRLTYERLSASLVDGRKTFRFLESSFSDEAVPRMLDEARRLAEETRPRRISESLATMRSTMDREIERLRSLQEINDHVRPREVERLLRERDSLEKAIAAADMRLDALRLIWKTSKSPGA